MEDKILAFVILVLLVVIALMMVTTPDQTSHGNLILIRIKENFSKIDPRFYNVPIREGKKSYTEGKKIITMCLKDHETGRYYDMNTLMYVAIHELAHVISKSYGEENEHNEEFRRNFTELLARGTAAGIYDPTKPIPSKYCGVGS